MAAFMIWNMMHTGNPFDYSYMLGGKVSKPPEKEQPKPPNDMKETVDKLFQESEELLVKCNDLTTAMESLRKVRPSEAKVAMGFTDPVGDTIESLRTEYNELVERRHTVLDAITALQKVCKHDYHKTSNDSHYDYCTCSICKHEIKC